jgi:hypothetical protein
MTAPKARNGKKKARKAPAKRRSTGGEPKVVTFRLEKAHRDTLTKYAIDLAAQTDPPKHISNNEAVKHMIMHAKVPPPEVRPSSEAVAAQPS